MKNNTIALLVGILIVISVASILSTPKQIANFRGVTGQATGESNVLFNLSEEVSVKVMGSINFGGGKVNTSAPYAILDSDVGYYNFSFNNISADVGTMPSKRLTPMVFDSKRGVFVIYGGTANFFGGNDSGDGKLNYRNDTWEFNYSSKTWTEIPTSSTSGHRSSHSIAYDSFNNKTIVYGGLVEIGTGIFEVEETFDTWAYNGTDWTNMSPVVTPIESYGAMAFDSKRNVTVLFGGINFTSYVSNILAYNTYPADIVSGDTWEYNYALNNWTNVTGSISGSPSRRFASGMVFNPDNNLIYLFGGKTNGSIIYDDVWTYDGSTWTQLTTYGYPKPVRSFFIEDPTSNDPSLVFEPIYDSQRHKIVVYVSYYPGTGSNYNFSFWDLDPATNKWEYIRDISNKYAGGADYDSLNNVTVFFLGSKDVGVTNGAVRETWVYNYSTLESDINGSWQFYRDYFFIENDGTVNISLNYSADKAASAFVGGLSPSFMLKGVVEHDGACDNLNTSYVEVVSSGENVLCDVLHFPQLNDTVRAAIRLQVPSNVNAGEHNSTITFTGRVV